MTTVRNKDGIEFDIDTLATDINGKMDKDGTNSSALSDVFMSLFCPDWSNGTNKTAGQNNTAESSGFLYIFAKTNGSGNTCKLTINDVELTLLGSWDEGSGQNWGGYLIPIAKSDVYKVTGSDVQKVVFYPFRGISNS